MPKIISFDVWDTIIKRRCHPEEIKLATAKQIVLKYNKQLKEEYKDIYTILRKRNEIEASICKENEQKGKDSECDIKEVLKKLQEEIFDVPLEDLSEELVRIEIEEEKKSIYINPDILPIFEKYKDLDMYCISDFYMKAENLKEILDSLNLPVTFQRIYSSADNYATKRTGKLYKQVEEELGISPKDHIHVGDNPYSDIDMAKSLGIETIHIQKENESFSPTKNRDMNICLDTLKKKEDNKENRLFNIGVDLAPILYFYGYGIVEYAIKNKIEKVYYCTREGETFIKIHEMMEENNPFGVNLPSSEIVEVSRIATFSASLTSFSIVELLRIWSQYRHENSMSMKAIFKSLNIAIEPYEEYLQKYEINSDKKIYDAWFDPRIQDLCEDQEFVTKMNAEFAKKKEALLEYFEKAKGIKNDSAPFFGVDIGWRGTILDNLCYIFDQKKMGSYYLTLYDFYNRQPKNSYKVSFMDNIDIRDNEINDMITLLEWIYNPGTGSVVGYENGKAIRRAKEEELKVVKEYIQPLQEGMLQGAEKLNEYMKYHPYEAEETKEMVYDILRKIKVNPPKDLVDAYYNMVFNDTFGSAEYIEKDKKLGFFTRMNPFKCRQLLKDEMWKEAFMVYHGVKYMKPLMNLKSTIRKIMGRK